MPMNIYTGMEMARQVKNTRILVFETTLRLAKLSDQQPRCYPDCMDAHSLQPPTASYQVLLEVAEAIAAHRDLGDLFHDLAGRLHRVVQFDYLNLILHDAKRNVMRLHTLEANRPTKVQPGLETPIEWSAAGHVFETQEPLLVPDVMRDERFPKMREILSQENIVSYCILPLTTAQHRLGCLGFGHGIKQ